MFDIFGFDGSRMQSGFRVLFGFIIAVAFANITVILLVFWQIPPFSKQNTMPFALLYGLVIEMALLVLMIAYRFVVLYHSSRGARLQKRMIWLTALLIVAPVTMVNIFSVTLLDLGLGTWFSQQVKIALEESESVADQYLEEHRLSLSRDMLGMARSFAVSFPYNSVAQSDLQYFLQQATEQRHINQAIIFEALPNGQTKVLARVGLTALLELDPIENSVLQRASQGEVVLILGQNVDQARGLIKLRLGNALYLYAGRYVSAQVVAQTAVVKGAVQNFSVLEQQLDQIRIGLLSVFFLFSALCVLISIYFSMTFARSVVAPITRLTTATQKIQQGDLSVRVDTEKLPNDETGQLSNAFNSMTASLDESQKALISANKNIAESRDYTQSILSSVSTGIIAISHTGIITSINDRAREILQIQNKKQDIDLLSLFPELGVFLKSNAQTSPSDCWEQHLAITLPEGRTRSVLLRVVQLCVGSDAEYLLSIDDVTELESAQRLAAWSEVARRIAHEIRNPLTPIRLATERLRRKFVPILNDLAVNDSPVLEKDSQGFKQSTETILRQVDNIAKMVKEFSDFARMPKANFAEEDICNLCREAAFIEQNRDHHVPVKTKIPEEAIYWQCDRHQILQVLVNLLKNAAEAILESPRHKESGSITLSLEASKQQIRIRVSDTGPGWPEGKKEKLFDPYHTLRETGTGLGLSVVKRILHDHQAECLLHDRQEGGAEVDIVFPRSAKG